MEVGSPDCFSAFTYFIIWSSCPVNALGTVKRAVTAMYTFGTPLAGEVGMLYRLCMGWNAGNESDHLMEVQGEFELKGPIDTDMACTLGLPCNVSFDGVGLAATNRIVVLSQGECGDKVPEYVDDGDPRLGHGELAVPF